MIYVTDASNVDLLLFCLFNQKNYFSTAKKELHLLLEDPELFDIPLLIVGNKIDLHPHLSQQEIIEGISFLYNLIYFSIKFRLYNN